MFWPSWLLTGQHHQRWRKADEEPDRLPWQLFKLYKCRILSNYSITNVAPTPDCKFRNYATTKGSKKTDMLRSGWPLVFTPPPSTVSFLWFFWCVFYLRLWFCVLKQILHKKKVIFIQLLESPILPYCLLLLCHKIISLTVKYPLDRSMTSLILLQCTSVNFKWLDEHSKSKLDGTLAKLQYPAMIMIIIITIMIITIQSLLSY